MGYFKAPEQPQSSARPTCHSHAMTRTGRETSHHTHCCIGARRITHCATGDDYLLLSDIIIAFLYPQILTGTSNVGINQDH